MSKKTETVQIRLSKEEKQALERLCKRLCKRKGLNITDMILYSLMKVINEEQHDSIQE